MLGHNFKSMLLLKSNGNTTTHQLHDKEGSVSLGGPLSGDWNYTVEEHGLNLMRTNEKKLEDIYAQIQRTRDTVKQNQTKRADDIQHLLKHQQMSIDILNESGSWESQEEIHSICFDAMCIQKHKKAIQESKTNDIHVDLPFTQDSFDLPNREWVEVEGSSLIYLPDEPVKKQIPITTVPKSISVAVSPTKNIWAAIGGRMYIWNTGGFQIANNYPSFKSKHTKAVQVNGVTWALDQDSTHHGKQNGLYQFDITHSIWKKITDIPCAATLRHYAVCVVQDCIYIIGGMQDYTETSDVFRFNTRTREWDKAASLTSTRYGMSVVVHQNKIYVIGGKSEQTLQNFEEYDPQSNTWEVLPRIRDVRVVDAAACVYDGKLFLMGGYDTSTRKVTNSVIAYDFLKKNTIVYADLVEAVVGASACSLNGVLYLIGGFITFKSQEAVGTMLTQTYSKGVWKKIKQSGLTIQKDNYVTSAFTMPITTVVHG